MKKLFLLLVCFISFNLYAKKATPFLDVPPDNWAYTSIKKLYLEGIIRPDDDFFIKKSNKPVTRYQLALLLARYLEKYPEKKKKTNIKKLCADFKPELSMLGLRISNLEKNMIKVKDDVYDAMLEVERLKNPDLRKKGLKINLDSRTRFAGLDYKDTALNKIEENYFVSRTGINIDYSNEGFNGKIRLERDAYFNTQSGDWTSGRTVGNQKDTSLYTSIANLTFPKPYRKCDFITIGRQSLKLASGMLIDGTADAYYSEASLPYFKNIKSKNAAIKMDTSIKRPFDLEFMDFLSDYKGIGFSAYYMHQKNPFKSVTSEVTNRKADYIFDGYSGNYTWYGLTADYKAFGFLNFSFDGAFLDWEKSLLINSNSQDGGYGYRASMAYGKEDDIGFDLIFTRFSDYFFAPRGSNNYSIFYYDSPSTKLSYNEAGYSNGFDDFFLEIRYPFSEKMLLTGRIEGIDDKLPHYSSIDDDRTIFTGIIGYKYKPHTRFNLIYKKIRCNDNSNDMAVNGVIGNPELGYTGSAGAKDRNGLLYNVNDLSELWLEILLNY